MRKVFTILFLLLHVLLHAQTNNAAMNDTLPEKILDSVTVNAYIQKSPVYLNDVEGLLVFAGKKTNMLLLENANANLPQNNARTAFARIPGLNNWEMDGAGLQVNISSRGTDAHRSIEMNCRQNGYTTNSDLFGYPENHYTVPMQAIQEVQLLRGSAALQFGSQYGGMINYVMKDGDSTKPFAMESMQTYGSNNFFNSYNAAGGTAGKLRYYAYYDLRRGDGWRKNSAFTYHAYYANLEYRFNEKGSIAVQFSRMDYVSQIAGGLTDAQFAEDARQSLRSRNFFQPVINIPAVIFKYNISGNTKLQVTASGLFGERNSVQFLNPPNIADTFNTSTGSYNARQVDRDYYSSFATEIRLLHNYNIGHTKTVLAAGLRFSAQLTKRKQKGTGTTGSDFDLSLTKPYGIDLRFNTVNYAFFAENIFQLTKRFSVTPGFRYEIINSKLSGVISNSAYDVSYKGNRNFPLFGTGLQYAVNSFSQLYGNISQAYRPYLYSNITPADRIDVVDANLKDSKGYDIDAGYRGHYKNILDFDVNVFRMFYGNRVGLITETKTDGSTYLLTTNIGDAAAKGAEAYIELSLLNFSKTPPKNFEISIFTSFAYTHATYTNAAVNKGGVNTSLNGNRIENTPYYLNRTGLHFGYKTFSAGVQYSYTGKVYNDAFNTAGSSNGVTGIVPAYHVWDINFEYSFGKIYYFSGGINNAANQKYFNRRITFYPGPGILPADGRTFYVTIGIKI